MVSDDGRVKILDFGLAKYGKPKSVPASAISDYPTRRLIADGRISGTLPYMSPEQLRERPLDHRCDIFSLGVIFYEMATGRRPFAGETMADLVASILKDSPTPVAELNPDLPRHLGRVIQQCLEKDPQKRLQSAVNLRDELAVLSNDSGALDPDLGPSIAVLPFADMSREKNRSTSAKGSPRRSSTS